MTEKPLIIQTLGDLEVRRAGRSLLLPPSKKTRALLAYLAVTGRAHRRERLCSLLWDVTDDPRGALRWSLSKLRALVDEPGQQRIVADRDQVAFHAGGARVDAVWLAQLAERGISSLPTEQLQEMAACFRGEFLEGLELGEFDEFQAWCVAEREELRRLQARVAAALVEGLTGEPERALPHARTLVHAEPLDEAARVGLLELLWRSGRRQEAEQQYQSACRLFDELKAGRKERLQEAWKALQASGAMSAAAASLPPQDTSPGASAPASSPTPTTQDLPPPSIALHAGGQPLVGRNAELAALRELLGTSLERRQLTAVLLSGEPGIGKTRLLAALAEAARERRASVLGAAAHEVESTRAYGPWVDLLARLSRRGRELPPELSPLVAAAGDEGGEHNQERLFDAVVNLLRDLCGRRPPLLLMLDDVQWCDASTLSLLSYVARRTRREPVFLLLAARSGELGDSPAVSALVRAWRRDGILRDLELGPLSAEETRALMRTVAPERDDAQAVAASGGNPLFALELARADPSDADRGAAPQNLRQLVRDRLARLSPDAADVLRWAAVLGHAFSVASLGELSSLPLGDLVSALEELERHALVREAAAPATDLSYVFSHDIVHRVVYGELSAPRRRLMHGRVAEVLAGGGQSAQHAAELAHHAALGGQALLAARACVAAGRHSLRLFAHAEAHALARRGLRHAEALADPERVALCLELWEVSVNARRPAEHEAAVRQIEALSERAQQLGRAEHARLGFYLLSLLRWERGDFDNARRDSLRAERVSRDGSDQERVIGLAEAARCLLLLEHDLPEAERLLTEASERAGELGAKPASLLAALGLSKLHQGQFEEATALLREARSAYQRSEDARGEFHVLEILARVEFEQERSLDHAERRRLCEELHRIALRLGEGSEVPFARCLLALCRYADGEAVGEDLGGALPALRAADAKQRLAHVLTRLAELDARAGDPELAARRAAEALELARLLDRPSDVALAHLALVHAARAAGDADRVARQLDALKRESLRGVSAYAERRLEALFERD